MQYQFIDEKILAESDSDHKTFSEATVESDDPEEMDDAEVEDARNLMCKKITEAFKSGWTKEYLLEYAVNTDDDDDDNQEE